MAYLQPRDVCISGLSVLIFRRNDKMFCILFSPHIVHCHRVNMHTNECPVAIATHKHARRVAHRQSDFYIISQRAAAKTKLTDNNESKRKINGKK